MKQLPGVSPAGIRTETTLNNPRDFFLGKPLNNLPVLRPVGFSSQPTSSRSRTSQPRLRRGRRNPASVEPSPGSQRPTRLSPTPHRPPRAGSVACPGLFRLLPCGFSHRELREQVAMRTGLWPTTLTPGRMTYDLRRLRRYGIMERIPQNSLLPSLHSGYALALFFTHARLYRPSVSQLNSKAPLPNSRLAQHFQPQSTSPCIPSDQGVLPRTARTDLVSMPADGSGSS